MNYLVGFVFLLLGVWAATLALFLYIYLKVGRELRREATRFLVECRQGHLDWALWLEENSVEGLDAADFVGDKEWHLSRAEGFELALAAFGAKLED